jgi:hypothetical protein
MFWAETEPQVPVRPRTLGLRKPHRNRIDTRRTFPLPPDLHEEYNSHFLSLPTSHQVAQYHVRSNPGKLTAWRVHWALDPLYWVKHAASFSILVASSNGHHQQALTCVSGYPRCKRKDVMLLLPCEVRNLGKRMTSLPS